MGLWGRCCLMRKIKENRFFFLAFLLLVLVSAYRQFSLHLLPGDFIRPYVVYTAYLVLIFGWINSIRTRFTQKSMRIFLLGNASVMLFWLTVRFVQDAFLYPYLYWMRYSGYFILIPAVAVPLLGFYASFGLGRGDEYRFSPRWYLLTLPAASLITLALTDNLHHFVCYLVKSELQPNLYFHPYIGTYLIYGWALVLICARTVVICKRNQTMKHASLLKKLAPFSELLLLLLFGTPYTVASFSVNWELIEFSAGVFFIEAVSWKIYIITGLIPVNTQYAKVFDCSTVAMQIVSKDGTLYVKSSRAPAIEQAIFRQLKQNSIVAVPNGLELQMFPVQDSFLIWQRDVSQIHTAIEELRQSTEELKQESILLGRELEFHSEDAAAKEQDAIYNQLSSEVSAQLSKMKDLLQSIRPEADNTGVFRQICFVGTYIKRRCNLRLTGQADGQISGEDVELSFRDLLDCLSESRVKTALSGQPEEVYTAQFALSALDLFERVLEQEQFAPSGVQVAFWGDCCISVESDRTPAPNLQKMDAITCETTSGGYRIILRKGAYAE